MRGLIYTLGAAAIAMGASYAQSAVAPFDYSYEGDALPTASTPVWTQNYGGPGTSATVSGGVLTLSTAAATDLMFQVSPGAWSPDADGTTVEARLKIDSQAGAVGAGDLTILTGTRGWKFAFRTVAGGYISDIIGGGSFSTASVGVDPTDGFHTYRFAITGQSGPADLYIDGNTTPAYSWPGLALGSNSMNFGDDLGDDAGVVQWDYVAWTNNGAFAPVPEPAALSLLGLGALALRRSARKCS